MTLFRTIIRLIRRYLWLILALLGLFAAFSLGRMTAPRAPLTSTTQPDQASIILGKVARLIELPAGETPAIAMINNASQAKQTQPFLTNAVDGDVLIVYQNAAEAILYRPGSDKLIAVGPVNRTPDQGAATVPATTTNATTTNNKKK